MILAALALAQAASGPILIPKPAEMQLGRGEFVLTDRTTLANEGGFASVKFLNEMLGRAAGFRLQERANPSVRFVRRTAAVVPAGGYQLSIRSNGLVVQASDDAGAFYAIQTIRQMLPDAIESARPQPRMRWALPVAEIKDQPRFSWRGMHLDVSRHFFGVDFIKRYIDWIAFHKMNVFHWHLIDDGGWRMESRKYPKLTEKGAWRLGKAGEWSYSNIVFPDDRTGKQVYGGFYTRAQIRDVVRYAAERHVTVVPEIEMPGHNQPAIACYPELGCRIESRKVNNVFCPGNQKAMQFLKDILDETLELFPSKFIHIGADEVDRSDWLRCPDCASVKRSNGLKDDAELQSWFVRQMDSYLSSKGRRLVGWDEILDGGLAPSATVMSWRGISGGIAAARQGRNVVMSPTSHCYFDYPVETLTPEVVYSFDPIPAELTTEQGRLVLGGQGNVWTEWIPTEDRCQRMIFPRMTALSETLWSPKQGRSWAEFEPRLMSFYRRYQAMNVVSYPPAPRVQGPTAYLFRGPFVEFQVAAAPTPFHRLRYTTDGSLPNHRSPEFKSPWRVSESASRTVALVDATGFAGPPVTLSAAPLRSVPEEGLVAGLKASAFLGRWSVVPPFASLRPAASRNVDSVDLALQPREEDFALRFEGFFRAPVSGAYRFRLTSDDGSFLSLWGVRVLDHDGLHGPTAKEATVDLPAGCYPLVIGYFEQGGAQTLKAEVQEPGRDWEILGARHLRRAP